MMGDAQGEISEALQSVETVPTGNRRPRTEETSRRVEALSLRLAGLSYEQIGERLGITQSSAHHLVGRALERAYNQNVEELREIEKARLDRAQAAIWPEVLRGNLKAVDTWLRISTRRAKLDGLDAPTELNLNVNIRQNMAAALADLEAVVMADVVDAEVIEDD